MELTPLNPPEKTRVYTFPGGEKVTLADVVAFKDSETTHRLRTGDGRLHIVPKTFLHIALEAKDFTL